MKQFDWLKFKIRILKEKKNSKKMVATSQLKATTDGLIWPKKPLVSSSGLISCLRNIKYRKSQGRSAVFKCVSFHVTNQIFAAADEKGHVFVFFVKSNR